ncbi:hypothetical protein RUM43_003565 [Polyplax serrata]|uniref:Cyclic nucleotide-binding domain-containing protein n=1 Tax=Polyplax serrata TaxID=468196 RepID=A0AAN8PFQ7_POLSC
MGKQQQSEHVCRFNRTNKTLEILFPKHLKFSKLRRKFREFMLISEENCRRQCTPKGTASYRFEKEKHLTQHYYMIHPYSKFRQYWEMIAVVEIILSLTIRTFLISQLRDEILCCWYYQMYAFFSDLFETMDATILTLVTGYLDPATRTVALEIRKVFLYNIKQLKFYVNIVTSFPLDFFVYVFSIDLQVYCILKFCVFLKIFKLVTIHRYLTHFSKIYNWSELIFRIVWITVAMFSLCHTFSCLFYIVIFGTEFGEPDNKFDTSYNCFYRHFSIFYLITTVFLFQNGISNNIVISSTKDMIFFILLLVTVNLTNIVFLGHLIQIFGLQNTSFVQYEEMIQEVHKFLIQENLPKHIHNKVVKYFEFRYRHRYFREKIILETLSPPLRQEIANSLCMDLLLGNNSIFKGIPQDLANALCLKLKFEVYLSGDVLSRAGKDAKKMFFIYCGSIALFSQRGKEITHLYDGQQFGASAFTRKDHQYVVTAIALEMSECYVLRYRDYVSCFNDYPEYRDIVSKAASVQKFQMLRHPSNVL